MRKEQFLIPLARQIIGRPRIAAAFGRLDKWGNPYTDEVQDDPMILADAMRKDGYVAWHPLYQQWFIMGWDEAREVLSSPHVSAETQMEVLLDVNPYTKLDEGTRTFIRNLLLLTDPPKHTRLRGLVNRAFTPRQVSRLQTAMIERVDGLLADFGDEVDLMQEFALRFPAMVIAELMGFDANEWQWLQRLSFSLTKITDPIRSFDPVELDDAFRQLRQRTLELVEKRQVEPAEDLLTALAAAEQDGDRLSEDELVAMVGLIMIAGHETTSSMIGLGTLLLHEHPDQLALLRRQPELWPNAVEEILRMDPTFRTDPRSAAKDLEIGGQTIKKGQNLVVMVQLANRDPRRMVDPDEFRVDRDDPSSLSFGYGPHYCLGASLARLELQTALPRLMDKLENYTIDRSKVDWRESLTLRGPASFPVERSEPAPAH